MFVQRPAVELLPSNRHGKSAMVAYWQVQVQVLPLVLVLQLVLPRHLPAQQPSRACGGTADTSNNDNGRAESLSRIHRVTCCICHPPNDCYLLPLCAASFHCQALTRQQSPQHYSTCPCP